MNFNKRLKLESSLKNKYNIDFFKAAFVDNTIRLTSQIHITVFKVCKVILQFLIFIIKYNILNYQNDILLSEINTLIQPL